MSANMRGDGWRVAHDAVKHHVCLEVEDHFGRSRFEVAGLFSDLLDSEEVRGRDPGSWEEVTERVRKGAVPDIGAALQGEAERLYEVKGIYPCPSRYPHCSVGGRARAEGRCACSKCRRLGGRAVDVRGAKVAGDVNKSLSKLEVKLGMAASAAEVGPLQLRLRDLGGVHELVFGSFGGVSRGFHRLLDRMAEKAAPLMWRDMLSPSIGHCKGVIKTLMQRDLRFVLARSRSYLLHSRLGLLRGGWARAGAAFYRREEARACAARPGYGSSGDWGRRQSEADWGWCAH